MLGFSKRLIAYLLLILMLSTGLYGCKKSEEAADENKVEDQSALDDAVADVLNDGQGGNEAQNPDQNTDQNAADTGAVTPTITVANASDDYIKQQPVAETSPVAITRVDMGRPDSPTGAESSSTDKHKHEKAPTLFELTPCQVEVNGIYKVAMAKELLTKINKRRSDYGVSSLTMGTSLTACADSRCKEQTYFVGHFRPDGSPFTSVSPEGYVQGELIGVDYRTTDDMMEAFFSVNASRYEMMNPDYTQCGISIYDIDGTYYVAVEFAY